MVLDHVQGCRKLFNLSRGGMEGHFLLRDAGISQPPQSFRRVVEFVDVLIKLFLLQTELDLLVELVPSVVPRDCTKDGGECTIIQLR